MSELHSDVFINLTRNYKDSLNHRHQTLLGYLATYQEKFKSEELKNIIEDCIAKAISQNQISNSEFRQQNLDIFEQNDTKQKILEAISTATLSNDFELSKSYKGDIEKYFKDVTNHILACFLGIADVCIQQNFTKQN